MDKRPELLRSCISTPHHYVRIYKKCLYITWCVDCCVNPSLWLMGVPPGLPSLEFKIRVFNSGGGFPRGSQGLPSGPQELPRALAFFLYLFISLSLSFFLSFCFVLSFFLSFCLSVLSFFLSFFIFSFFLLSLFHYVSTSFFLSVFLSFFKKVWTKIISC